MAEKEAGSVVIKTQLDTSEINKSVEDVSKQISGLSKAMSDVSKSVEKHASDIQRMFTNMQGQIANSTKSMFTPVEKEFDKTAKDIEKKSKKKIAPAAKGIASNVKSYGQYITSSGSGREALKRAMQLTDNMSMKVEPLIPHGEISPVPAQYRLLAQALDKAGAALINYIRQGKEADRMVSEHTHVLELAEQEEHEYADAVDDAARSLDNLSNKRDDKGIGISHIDIDKAPRKKDLIDDLEEEDEVGTSLLSGVNKAVDVLKDAFESLGGVIKPVTKSMLKLSKVIVAPFKAVSNSFKNFVNNFRESGLLNFFGELGQDVEGVMFILGGGGLLERFTEVGSNLTEVQNVVDVTFEEMSGTIDKFAKGASKAFGLSETMAKQFTGTLGAMAKSFGFSNSQALDMSRSLAALAGDVASFYNLDQKEAFNKLKAVFTGETEGLKSLGVVMTQTALEQFALSKGIQKSIKDMTEQEKVALRYNYVLDKLSGANGDFSRTSQTWANQTRLLKLQIESLISTLGQGLINILNPLVIALNKVLEKVVKLTEAFRKLTVELMGGDIEETTSGEGAAAMAAGEAIGNLADETEEETEATKKAEKEKKKYLSGLDEIARWDDGKKDENNESALMDIDPFDREMEEDADDIIEVYDSIPAKINGALKKIYDAFNEWSPKIAEFMKGLAEKLNDFVSKIDWEQFGKTIGAGLNLIVNALNSFLDNVDWENIGKSIANALNGLLEEVDWFELGRLLTAKIRILTDLFYGFVTNTDWDKVGKSLAELINGAFTTIDWGKIGQDLMLAVGALFTAMKSFNETLDWGEIGRAIPNLIKGALSEANPQEWGETAGVFLNNVLGILKTIAEETPWAEVGDTIGELIRGFFMTHDLGEWGTTLGLWCNALFTAVGQAAKKIPFAEIGKQIGQAISKFFENADFAEWGRTFNTWMMGLLDMLIAATDGENLDYAEVGRKISEGIAAINWKGALFKLGTIFKNVFVGLLTGIFDGAADSPEKKFEAAFALAFGGLGIASKVAGMFGKGSAIDVAFTFLAGHPILSATGAIIAVTAALGGFEDINVDWDGLKNHASGALDAIIGSFNLVTDSDSIKEAGTNIAKAIGKIVEVGLTITEPLIDVIAGLLSVLAMITGGLLDGAALIINGIADAFRDFCNSQLVQDIKALVDATSGFVDEFDDDSYSAIIEKLSGLQGAGEDAYDAMLNLISELEKDDPALGYTKSIDQLKTSLQNAKEEGKDFDADVIEVISSALTIAGVPADEFNSKLDSMGGLVGILGDNSESAAEGVGKLQSAAETTAEATGAIGELLQGLEQSTSLNDYQKLTALIEALDTTQGSSGDADAKLQGLRDRLSEAEKNGDPLPSLFGDIASTLEECGVQAGDFADDLANGVLTTSAGIPDELSKITKAVKDEAKKVKDEGGKAIGDGIKDGTIESLNAGGGDVAKASKTMADNNIKGEIDKSLDIKGNVSGEAKKDAEAVGEGIIKGEESKESAIKTKSKDVIEDDVMEIFDDTLKNKGSESAETKKRGEAIDAGLASGEEEKIKDVKTASEKVTDEGVKDVFDTELTKENAEKYANTFMDALANAISDKASDMGDAMEAALAPAIDEIERLSDSFTDMFDGVVAPFNDFIGRLNSLLVGVENIQHEIARLLSMRVDIPADVAAATGVQPFSLNMQPLYSTYRVPLLAKGAVIPPNSPYLAVLGDQKRGTNIEAPLATIEQAVVNAMNKNAGGNNGRMAHITVTLDRKVLFDTVIDAGRDNLIKTGNNAFEMG